MSGADRAVEIVVDELVLRGVPREQADAVTAAFEARLGALGREWASSDALRSGRSEAFRRVSAVDAPAGSPAGLGDAVAGAVWGAIDGGSR